MDDRTNTAPSEHRRPESVLRWAGWATLVLVALTVTFRRFHVDPGYAWVLDAGFFIALGASLTRERKPLGQASLAGFLAGAAIGFGSAAITFLTEWRFHLFFAIVTDATLTGFVGLLFTAAAAILFQQRMVKH